MDNEPSDSEETEVERSSRELVKLLNECRDQLERAERLLKQMNDAGKLKPN